MIYRPFIYKALGVLVAAGALYCLLGTLAVADDRAVTGARERKQNWWDKVTDYF